MPSGWNKERGAGDRNAKRRQGLRSITKLAQAPSFCFSYFASTSIPPPLSLSFSPFLFARWLLVLVSVTGLENLLHPSISTVFFSLEISTKISAMWRFRKKKFSYFFFKKKFLFKKKLFFYFYVKKKFSISKKYFLYFYAKQSLIEEKFLTLKRVLLIENKF